MCTLDIEWLLINGGVGDDGDGGGGGVQGDCELGEEGERRVVGIRSKEGTEFQVDLSSGESFTCALPPIYLHGIGKVCLF